MNVKTLSVLLTVVFACFSSVNAQLDPIFGNNGVVIANTGSSTELPIGSFVLPDGKILVVATTAGVTFLRFNSDGTPDATVGTNGQVQITPPYTNQGSIRSCAIQPDGKVILVGRWDVSSSFIARYNQNGTLDTSFNGTGFHHLQIRQFDEDELVTVLVQPDGKILAAGYAEINPDRRLAIVRYLSNGILDPSLGGGGMLLHEDIRLPDVLGDQYLYLQSSGKILIANTNLIGSFGSMLRFNTDGSVDGSFTAIPYTTANGFERRVSSVQSDDKILTAGIISKTETLERVHNDSLVARYNADGTPDTGFGTGGSVSVDITSYQHDAPIGVHAMPDGQIVVVTLTAIFSNRSTTVGGFLSYARLSSNGSVVNGKFLGTHASAELRNPAFTTILPDGRILTTFRRLVSGGWDVLLARSVGVPLQTYLFHGVPYLFSSASGGYAKPSLYRPSTGSWLIYPFSGSTFGQPDDIPASADYIGTLAPDLAFYRPSTGTWYISKNNNAFGSNFLTVHWGLAGDIPVAADYDGDGKDDVAVFRPSDGVWYIRNSADESWRFVRWGLSEDKPAVGDFDGDGKYDISVFRPSEGNWYIYRSSDGGFTILHFGLDGDIPVQEDYDGDGKFDIAVYRPSDGVWYRLNSSDGSISYYQWGLAGDIPVPADYDADKKINIAVWRPSNGFWYIVNPDLVSMHFYIHGNPTDVPLPGRF